MARKSKMERIHISLSKIIDEEYKKQNALFKGLQKTPSRVDITKQLARKIRKISKGY